MAVEILVTSFTFPSSLETSINRRKEKKKGLDRVNDRFDVARAKERRITTRIEQRYLSRSRGIIIEIKNKTREFTKWIEFDFAPDTRTLN